MMSDLDPRVTQARLPRVYNDLWHIEAELRDCGHITDANIAERIALDVADLLYRLEKNQMIPPPPKVS